MANYYYDTRIKDLKVRTTNKSDVDLILSFIKGIAEYEKMTNEVIATKETLLKSIFELHQAEVLIAEYNNIPIGFALFFESFSTFIGHANMYLEDFYVNPEYRHNGFGKEIFRILALIAKQRGYERFEWTCLNWNTSAQEFYKKMGAVKMSEWTVHRLVKNQFQEIIDK